MFLSIAPGLTENLLARELNFLSVTNTVFSLYNPAASSQTSPTLMNSGQLNFGNLLNVAAMPMTNNFLHFRLFFASAPTLSLERLSLLSAAAIVTFIHLINN